MSGSDSVAFRRATPADATALGALAIQVFLDTYATQGVDPALAGEALDVCGPAAFARRLADPQVEITLVHRGAHLVGFMELALGAVCSVAGIQGPEVVRLYIQAPSQRRGIGRGLLRAALQRAAELGASFVWLSAWVGNEPALAFYRRVGWRDVGSLQYRIKGVDYENRVFAGSLNVPITHHRASQVHSGA